MRVFTQIRLAMLIGVAGVGLASPAVAVAQSEAARMSWNIPPQPMRTALTQFARRSKQQILFEPKLVRGLRSSGVAGSYSAGEALRQLLRGTNLTVRTSPSGAFLIGAANSEASTLISASAAGNGPRQRQGQDIDNQDVEGPSGPNVVPDGEGVQEIIVTAARREQRLVDVPASITAETGETLRRRGATQLEDIVRTTPGLSNAGSGGGNRTNLTIRNVSSGTDSGLKQATVAILFDDIPVDPASASIGTTNLRIVDVDRVEVLRGPQGTLFGSGSLSGAVRFVTNKPDLSDVSVATEITGTTTKAGDGSIWGNVVVNLPVVADKVGIRAVGYGFDEGGWIDNLRTGERDANSSRAWGGRLSVAAKPSERLSLSLAAMYQDSEDNAGGESLYTPAVPHVTLTPRSSRIDVENTLINFGAQYDLDGVTFLSSSTYTRRKVGTFEDASYFVDLLGFAFGIPGLTGQADSGLSNGADIYTQELRLSSQGNQALRWTAGLFYLKADAAGGQVIQAPVLAPVLGTSFLANLQSEVDQRELAGFGEATYTIADRFELTAGARVSRTKVAFESAASGLLITGNPNPAVISRSGLSQADTTVNPRVSLAFRPNRDTNLYLQASRGYRVGGPNLTAGLAGPGVPATYGSDHLWNYELGAKTRLADGRIQLSGALYYIDWSNIQSALVLNNIAYTGNAGSAEIYGFELEGVAQPVKWFQVGGSLSVSHSELTEDVPTLTRVSGALGVSAGERLPASPELQLGAFAQARFPALGGTGYIRASAQHVGEQFTDFGELGTRFGDYTVADLRAGISFSQVELVAFANNIFDSKGARGAAAAAIVGPVFVAPQRAYRVRPRTIGLTLRTSF